MFVAPAFAQESNDAHNLRTELEIDVHEEPVFPPFDSTTFASQLVWLAITFGLFYLFLKRVILPRISSIIEVRNDRIAQDLEQASRLKTEADAEMAAYEQELADAKAKANAIGQQARDGAKAEAETERKQIEASLESRLSEAEARIALIKDAAMRDVGSIAEETAGAIVQELIGAKADKSAVSAAVAAARS